MTTRTAPHMRLHINWTQCDGRGLCTELLPGILGRDDWGYPVPLDHTHEPHIPAGCEAEAAAAVRLCPRLALTLMTAP